MQRRTGKLGVLLAPSVSQGTVQRGDFMKTTTYLAKIAIVLQNAPNKMLTFTQLMVKLVLVTSEDRKCVENNIRVCLSSHKCFIKIPVVKDSLNSKRNYWKLDTSQITAKMVRRHFKGLLHLFPELTSKMGAGNMSRPLEQSSTLNTEPDACRAAQVRCEVKFNGPFSIESLLGRDSPSAHGSRASVLSSVQLRAEQQPQPGHRGAGTKRSFNWEPEERLLHTSAGSFPFFPAGGSTHYSPITAGAAQLTKRIPVPIESFSANAAPSFTSPHSSYITYSVPTFTHHAFCFSM